MLRRPAAKKIEAPQTQPRSKEVTAEDIRRLAEMIDKG